MKIVTLLLVATLTFTTISSSIVAPVSLAVTIYNDQFAMVKDIRSISFDQGRSDLYFTDVSSNIQPQTVTFKAIKSAESVRVFEQNYEKNLISTFSLLQKYMNKDVEIYTKLGETNFKINGTLLGHADGYILKTSDGIEVLNKIEGIRLPSLPQGFFTVPTLNWKVFSNKSLTTDCEVAYRTTGFSWKADYSVTLNEKQNASDIGGWVSIDNRSGKRYKDAKLKLIAGEVNTVSQRTPMIMYKSANAMADTAGSGPSFSEKSFSDFHMYTLSEPVSLNDNSQKQVEFIPKVYGVAVRKYNLILVSSGGTSSNNLKAGNRVEFQNTKANGLGIPLPKGTVRVFKADQSDGSLEFVGEDSIAHTPKDENITLKTGNAFDITANKVATNYASFGKTGYTASLNLTITNHKDIQAEIVVEFTNNGRSNLKVEWKNNDANVEKVSSSLQRVSKVVAANQKWSLLWTEDYRP